MSVVFFLLLGECGRIRKDDIIKRFYFWVDDNVKQ